LPVLHLRTAIAFVETISICHGRQFIVGSKNLLGPGPSSQLVDLFCSFLMCITGYLFSFVLRGVVYTLVYANDLNCLLVAAYHTYKPLWHL